MNKYFEDKKLKSIDERQKLKNIHSNQFSYNKVKELLNIGNRTDINFQMKGLLLNNIKYINPEIMKKSSIDRKKTIKNNKILFILKRRNTNNFNFVGFEDKKDTKKIKKKFFIFS